MNELSKLKADTVYEFGRFQLEKYQFADEEEFEIYDIEVEGGKEAVFDGRLPNAEDPGEGVIQFRVGVIYEGAYKVLVPERENFRNMEDFFDFLTTKGVLPNGEGTISYGDTLDLDATFTDGKVDGKFVLEWYSGSDLEGMAQHDIIDNSLFVRLGRADGYFVEAGTLPIFQGKAYELLPVFRQESMFLEAAEKVCYLEREDTIYCGKWNGEGVWASNIGKGKQVATIRSVGAKAGVWVEDDCDPCVELGALLADDRDPAIIWGDLDDPFLNLKALFLDDEIDYYPHMEDYEVLFRKRSDVIGNRYGNDIAGIFQFGNNENDTTFSKQVPKLRFDRAVITLTTLQSICATYESLGYPGVDEFINKLAIHPASIVVIEVEIPGKLEFGKKTDVHLSFLQIGSEGFKLFDIPALINANLTTEVR